MALHFFDPPEGAGAGAGAGVLRWIGRGTEPPCCRPEPGEGVGDGLGGKVGAMVHSFGGFRALLRARAKVLERALGQALEWGLVLG
jgi:hypothetical protein